MIVTGLGSVYRPLATYVDGLVSDWPQKPVEWNFDNVHYFDGGPRTLQYLLVVDTLNFCFWPEKGLEYEHLAKGLRDALTADPHALDAARLRDIDGPTLRGYLKWPTPLPLEDERVRLLHELGGALLADFEGEAANLVLAAKGSAVRLVELVIRHLPGFHDSCIYRGHQVFLYKRAQIFAADVWGAFKGQAPYANFADIGELTMFADYLVPAVLVNAGILIYTARLEKIINSGEPIAPGSEEEVEIRACTIVAVEWIREAVARGTGKMITSVEVDWLLWQVGESDRASVNVHHTLTIFY
eukprot:jgi/Mesvir1/3444/Mv11939-RA.1